MHSEDDHLISPYSTASFPGSFGSTSAESPGFQRYQHGDLVSTYYSGQESDYQLHNGHLDSSPNPQNFPFQVLGTPYMMAQTAVYGQQMSLEPASMSSQHMGNHFAPGMPEPTTPGHIPPSIGSSGIQYGHSPANGYAAQHSTTGPDAMAYSSPVTMSQSAEYPDRREAHKVSNPTLHRSNSASSESLPSTSYPPATNQSAPKLFTFVTPQIGGTPSDTSSFTSDSGTGSQRQKGIKKRGTVTATRRPRKPPLEIKVEPKLQTSPQIQRHAPGTTSPKRARTSISHAEINIGDTTPDSSLTVSPGTISKAHIGGRSRASTNASQQNTTTSSLVNGQRAQNSGEALQDDPEDARCLSQRLQEFMEVNRTITRRVDELDMKVQHLEREKDDLERSLQHLKHENIVLSRQHTEMKKTVVDIKCKVLEEFSVGDALRDRSPRADFSVGQQMTAPIDLRRPSTSSVLTSSTAISSRRASPTETVYSNHDSSFWYKPPRGIEQNEAEDHHTNGNMQQTY